MADTATAEPPPSPSPAQRKPGTFTVETARKAAQASVQARARKAQRLQKSEVTAAPPLPADADADSGVVVMSLPRIGSPLTEHDEATRLALAKSIRAQAEVLAANPPKQRKEIAGRDGTAQASKTLADAAATCYGWGNGSMPGLIVMTEVMPRPPHEQRAKITDCQTVKTVETKQPSQPANPACGVSAPQVPVASAPGASC